MVGLPLAEERMRLFTRFLDGCPHSWQCQLLEDDLHTFRWIRHLGLQPPDEQAPKGSGQVPGHQRQRNRRGTFACAGQDERLLNVSAQERLPGFPQDLSRVASQHRLKELVILLDMLKELQAGENSLSCIPLRELLPKQFEHLL